MLILTLHQNALRLLNTHWVKLVKSSGFGAKQAGFDSRLVAYHRRKDCELVTFPLDHGLHICKMEVIIPAAKAAERL